MLYRGRFINAMPRIATPIVTPTHDLDAGQALLRARTLLVPQDGPFFEREVRGL
jgi:hypothetical protein